MLCSASIDKIEPSQCFIIGLSTHVGHFLKFHEFKNIYSKKRGNPHFIYQCVFANISSVHSPVLNTVGNVEDRGYDINTYTFLHIFIQWLYLQLYLFLFKDFF